MTTTFFRNVLRMLAVLLLGSFVASAAAQHEAQTTRRFALVVGANKGGKARTELRYAQRDARAMATVLEQLGGVDRSDRILLLEPSPEQISIALRQLQERTRAARESGQRTELLFYYSGHSDERGLLLGEERLAYRDLRDGLASVAASVHVGVLDSCSSGALTRLKGGERRAPFLLDSANAVQGHAFLTSSSADEGAQESDRVGASFFTHYLVSGLRGAADFSGDGRVTLNEAYRFAFDETLARTEDTHAGPQHASYDIQLVGTGDLVMTDLRQPAAALALPKNLAGRMYLRDSQGNLVVELNKPAGRVIELALDAQSYQVLLDQDGRLMRASIALPAGTTTALRVDQFVVVEGQRNRLRGDELDVRAECVRVSFGAGLVPNVSTNAQYRHANGPGQPPPCVRNNVNFHAFWGQADQLYGVSLTLGGTQVRDETRGVQIALGVNLSKRLEGVQIAIAANHVETSRGVQLGVGPNLVAERFEGVQAGLVNLAKAGTGAQLGLINGAYERTGLQLGLINANRRMIGVQGGLINVNTQTARGLTGGLVNVTAGDEARGAQVGLVNVATGRLRGGQLGLINYAERTGGQVGLLSVTREGGVHGLLFTSDALPLQTGVRFDADHTYASIIGGRTLGQDTEIFGVGFGLGGKISLRNELWLEPGLDIQTLFVDRAVDDNPSNVSRLLMNLRYAFRPHLSVFGGPLFQVVVHEDRKQHDLWPGPFNAQWQLTDQGQRTQVLASVGFAAGLSL